MCPSLSANELKPRRGFLCLLLVLPLTVALLAFWSVDGKRGDWSPFYLANLIGPTARGLFHGQGLTTCTDRMGTLGNPICFHAGRMPLPPAVVALGVLLFGEHIGPVVLFKVLLLLLPLLMMLFVVWRRFPRSAWWQVGTTFLLLTPLTMTAFLADVENAQVEEGYIYSFLALAVALLFFGFDAPRKEGRKGRANGLPGAILFAVSVDAIYLAKSSMAPATLVLTIAYLLRQRRAGLRVLVLALVAIAPVGWALHQHKASGRFSFGTSIDGINLHKGNNEGFLDRYPPPAGTALDAFDTQLNAGHIFPNEWSFNDYHQHAAVNYMRAYPGRTMQAAGRKLFVVLFSVNKIGSSESRGLMLAVETGGAVLFRLILWTAIGCSVYGLARKRGGSDGLAWSGGIFLALLAACAVPYLLGFAYTRHVSILIYPSVLLCCRVLVELEPRGVKKG